MNILILANDDGHTFPDTGIPTPFIEVNGRTRVEWATRSIPFIGHYGEPGDYVESNQLYFAVRSDMESTENTDRLMRIYGDNINIIAFPKETQGNLETAFLCGSVMDLDDPFLIIDINTKYADEDILDTFVESMEFDGSMVVSYFDPLDEQTTWPFVYSDGALVTSIVENDKDAIVKGGRPLIGTYWFSSTRLFMKVGQIIIKNGLTTGMPGKEGYYLSQAPAMHAANAGAVFLHKVDEVVPLRTPSDIKNFQL